MVALAHIRDDRYGVMSFFRFKASQDGTSFWYARDRPQEYEDDETTGKGTLTIAWIWMLCVHLGSVARLCARYRTNPYFLVKSVSV